MEKAKNLEELIAAIGDDPVPAPIPATPFTAASAGIPIPVPARTVSAAPSRAPHAAATTAPRSFGTVAGNLDELVQYLGGNGSASVPASLSAQQATANQVPGFGAHSLPMIPTQQRPLSQHRIANPSARSTDPKLPSEYRRQQIHAAKAMQKRDAALSVSGHARAASGSALSTSKAAAGQSPPFDITAELTAVMQKNGASGVPRPTQRPVGAGGRPPQRPQSGQPSGRSQRPQITQEQIIVGHFCRHAIKTLARVMQNNPLKQQTEQRLKEHIKGVWAQWVRGVIQRQKLLESVASFVRNSCPQALGIDVMREFKTWYEREFELQKQRTSTISGQRASTDRRALHPQQQQQLAHQQRTQAPVKQQRKGQQVRGAVASRDQALQTHAANSKPQYAARGLNADRAMTGAKQAGREPQIAHPQFVKGEPQVLQPINRTGGKSISSKTVPSRKTPAAKSSKGAAAKAAVAGKSVANKSVGGKSISRPRPASVTKSQVGIKGPTTPAGPKGPTAGSAGPVGVKGVAGSKGLLANKLPAGHKPKGPRKGSGKGASKASPSKGAQKAPPPKTPGKGSPKGALSKQKASAASTPVGVSSPVAPTAPLPATSKRPLDTSGGSSSGAALKKAKTAPKGQKSGAGRKKNVSFPSTGGPGKNIKPPPARADMGKGRPSSGPSTGSGSAGAAGSNSKSGSVGTAGTNAAPGTQVRKVKRVDDELSVVHNVIDIENEEDMLGRDAGGGTSEVIEIFDYDADMLLAGPALRTKMQATAKRYSLDENISKDAMEIVSLAVHERLKNFLESLKGIAAVRVEASKASWSTETFGVSAFEKLERMREDEERSLTVAAELRVKRRKEQQEREAKKLAGEAEKEEKKNKDSSAAAEQERKEKLALEKKRKEDSSQRDALSGLLAGIDKKRKKPNASKTLAPLLPPITKSGGSRSSGSGLPPIPRLAGAGGLGSKGSVNLSKNGMKPDALEKWKALGPLVKLGGPRTSSMPGSGGKKGESPKAQAKHPLTLRDCLFLMESEQNTRKSSQIYKWYARLGTTHQVIKGK